MNSKNSSQINVPQAHQAMEQCKMQAAQEVGGHLAFREAGSIGGQMVCPKRTFKTMRSDCFSMGHKNEITCDAELKL